MQLLKNVGCLGVDFNPSIIYFRFSENISCRLENKELLLQYIKTGFIR